MKYTIDVLQPYTYDNLPYPWEDHNDWRVTTMVVYRPRQAFELDTPNGSYQMFWPVNPWHALDEISAGIS